MNLGFLSIAAPVLTIVLALLTKNVFISLFVGVFLGKLILAGYNVVTAVNTTLYSAIGQFSSQSTVIVILVTMMLGGLIKIIETNGGINGFVKYLTEKSGAIKTKRGASLFTWLIGVLVFTSGTVSCLVTGAVSRPVNEAMGVAPEKSAYIVHTTSTPVCVLLPLSGWGAYMIGLLTSGGVSVDDAPGVLVKSIYLNFYCLIAVIGTFLLIVLQKDFGPMKKIVSDHQRTSTISEKKSLDGKMSLLVLPLLTMIFTILITLYITGEKNLIKGDGYRAIYWGLFLSVIVALSLSKIYGISNFAKSLDLFFKGTAETLPMGAILVLAFTMGGTVKDLGTGPYLVSVFSGFLSPSLLPALIFLITCLISFTTGTSMGTMSLAMPLAMPIAIGMGGNIPLVAAAVWGGSIFGDHSSPISDTSILSCSTTNCDIISHVKTQIPYTLSFAVITILLYIVLGFIF
jgi:Na+/H+ antiporter NhaC